MMFKRRSSLVRFVIWTLLVPQSIRVARLRILHSYITLVRQTHHLTVALFGAVLAAVALGVGLVAFLGGLVWMSSDPARVLAISGASLFAFGVILGHFALSERRWLRLSGIRDATETKSVTTRH